MSETTEKCNAPRICEWCDHGGSVTISHAAPVFCNLRKEIKKYDQTCPDWKLIFSNQEVERNKTSRPTPDIESPAKPWQGKLSHSRGPSDDWGTIRDERQNAIIRVPITLDEEKLVEHRRAGTDPAQQIVDEILNRINSYEETKRQLDEAESKLAEAREQNAKLISIAERAIDDLRWFYESKADGIILELEQLKKETK